MKKKQFSTACDMQVFENFKNACSEYGVSMNTILEGLMRDFCNNEYQVTITKSGIELKKM